MQQEEFNTRAPGVDAVGHLKVVVGPDDQGARIDRFLGRYLAPYYSRSYLAALIEEGSITLDGKAVKPSFRVEIGGSVEGDLGRAAQALPGPEPMDIRVIHSDEALIVVDKPSGLIIHPGSGQSTGTLVNGLLHDFPEIAVVGRADRPGIVHRLDRETTGVMVVARTNDAARSLVNQFKRKTVKKEYCAVVWGEMPFDSDWIELPLGQDPHQPSLRAVVAEGGKSASTFYQVRKRLSVATVVSAFPRTGRTHQIRVHLAHIGFPIIGDGAYGRPAQQRYARWVKRRQEAEERVPIIQRHALHAQRLSFEHPATGEIVAYEAPLPADMADLVEVIEDS